MYLIFNIKKEFTLTSKSTYHRALITLYHGIIPNNYRKVITEGHLKNIM